MTDSGTARPVSRPGHLGALSVTQIVIAEALVLITVLVFTRGTVPGLIATAVALPLLVVVFARRHRRWWLEDLAIAWRHKRRRSAARDTGAGVVLAALRSIAPGLAVRDVSAPDGARVGVARDEAGWFSVVALTPSAAVHTEGAPIPLDTLVTVLAATEQPGVLLQLVTHTVPAPGADLHPGSPASSSYRQLIDSMAQGTLPSHRESWVTVRLDARTFAEALLDHTADLDTAAALVASLGRRVATSLRRLGVPCRVLDTDDLIGTLARSCDLESGVIGDAAQVTEDWTQWRSARLVHRTYWLKTWPAAAGQFGTLVEWVSTVRAAQTSIAVMLDPSGGSSGSSSGGSSGSSSGGSSGGSSASDEGDVAVRALVRVGITPDEDFGELEKALFEGVRSLGGELRSVDGEQGPAVYATAPTGGGAG